MEEEWWEGSWTGTTQPDVDAVPLETANCRKTSLLTGSAGLDSNGRAKQATWLPIHLVRGAGAVGDSKQGQQLPSDFMPTSLQLSM